MAKSALSLHPYRRNLDDGVGNARTSWNERRGVHLRWADEGRVGWGEAAPLPSYSPDDLDGSTTALDRIVTAPPEISFNVSRRDLRSAVSELLGAIPSSEPAARFALETAFLDRWAGIHRLPLPMAIHPSTGQGWRSPKTADLCSDPASLPSFEAAGRPVKIKVGRPGGFAAELEEISKLRRRFPELEIRLDANGAWSEEEAMAHGERLLELSIRWIEEPWRPSDRRQLASMVDNMPVPVALDESLGRLSITPEDFGTFRPAALILKPQVLGGALVCLDLARAARAVGASALASHTFDGPVAFRATTALASALDDLYGSAGHHGLAVHPFLKLWPELGPAATDPPAAMTPGAGWGSELGD